jgi:putative intracellular protease/amidase
MADKKLQGKRVAILATDGFEQDELLKPREALDDAGAETKVVSPKSGKIKGWKLTDWGKQVSVDVDDDTHLSKARSPRATIGRGNPLLCRRNGASGGVCSHALRPKFP